MLYKVILAIAVIMFSGNCFAQKSETDSLESLVVSVPSDTTKVWLLNKLVNSLREKDNNRALAFAQQAKDLAELLSYKNGLGYALENLGWILYRKGDYSQSLDVSTQALHISEEIKDLRLTAKCVINIAAIYYEQKQYDQAIQHFKKAYSIAKEIGDTFTMARSYNNIAFTFLGLNQLDSAFINAQKSLAISESVGNAYMIAFAKRVIGDVYLERNNTTEALKYFFDCQALSVKYDNTFLKASVLHRLGKTYALRGNYEKALSYLSENIQIAKQYGFKNELERAYQLCAKIYFEKNDLVKAYQYQSQYVSVHDSLYDQRNSEQIALMQIRYEAEMSQAQIELLTKDSALQNEVIERQKLSIYLYVGSLTLLTILAFVLYYNNRNNRKAKLSLVEKNNEIETQTHQLRNLNATKDKLFSIISHDLRSPVASLKALMEIAGTSGLTQEEFVDITNVLKRNLDTVYEDLDNLLLWAQTQLKGLQPFPQDIDLYKIAEEKLSLFSELAASKKITIINEISPEAKVFADKNHITIVFRNLLANAIKFNPSGGVIRLTSVDKVDYFEISISDSGIGLSMDEIGKLFNAQTHFTKPGTNKEKGMGIGLLLTKEFLETNNGSISVTSELGKGTTFTFTLKTSKREVFA